MALRGRGHQLRLVRHQLVACRDPHRGGVGQGMHAARRPRRARTSAAAAPAAPSRRGAAGGSVRGVRTAEKSGARKGLASWREITDCGTTRRSVGCRCAAATGGAGGSFLDHRGFEAVGPEHVPGQRAGRVGDDRVVGEQGEQAGVADGGPRQGGGEPVEPLELLTRAWPRYLRLVRLHPGVLLAGQRAPRPGTAVRTDGVTRPLPTADSSRRTAAASTEMTSWLPRAGP